MREITIRELTDGYVDNNEGGVKGFGGKLDIRPPFQREFVYKEKQRDAVIHTVRRNFPLNVMYWAEKTNDQGEIEYEVIDGQQRTISICRFVEGDFSIKDENKYDKYFHTFHDEDRNKILDYSLTVYLCSGSEKEKLEWFTTINIAGERLTEQELRNAVYTGSFVSDAKRYFSKNVCPAQGLGGDYLIGSSIRQEYLETVLSWISGSRESETINDYMSFHQNDPTAENLWTYFQLVITWVTNTIPKYRREMKGVEWGILYNQFKDVSFDVTELETKISTLMMDEDVTSKKGIYTYIFDGKEKNLSIRSFTDNQKRESFERQNGICPVCQETFKLEEMEADHIDPWHSGGKTISINCQMLCREDNRRKSGI